MGPQIQRTSLQDSVTPASSKGEHTRAPNILPSALAKMGTPASINGDMASSPGRRKAL